MEAAEGEHQSCCIRPQTAATLGKNRDSVVWRNNLGATTFTLPNRSGANTGAISQADYTFWKSRFGATSGSGSGLGSAVVPEPATVGLLLVAMVGVILISKKDLK